MKKKLLLSQSAKKIHRKLLGKLRKIVEMNIPSPLYCEFINNYNQFLTLYHEYQQEVIFFNKLKKARCKSGCSVCCYHWVEGVNSFEVEIISSFIKHHFKEKIDDIIYKFKDDEKELNILKEIVEQKLNEKQLNTKKSDIDFTEILLTGYYQLKRPCALLTEKKTCGIYSVRPLSCRMYMSFSVKKHCKPEYINSNYDIYTIHVDDEVYTILDTIHKKYKRYNNSGLRSLLIDYLTE
ncbi:MAG: YkgJ family cysteine cluster protein [Chitinispirillia bacterium]|jgi:Fe-S-cluster containining protein